MMRTTRATMPSGTSQVLDRRTVARDNKNLLPLLRKGMSVLDIGCGSGAITKGIAELTGVEGKVVGMDLSQELIKLALERYADWTQLTFVHADIFQFETDQKFDIVTTARTLQWIADFPKVIHRMKELLNPGGCIAILDYNHEKIQWTPAAPPAMQAFYNAFLLWREDAGMNNHVADSLEEELISAGFTRTDVSDESESSRPEDIDFYETAGIWKKVAELRGPEMVRDGYVTETERMMAIQQYEHWLLNDGASMKMYLMGVTGFLN